MERKKTDTNDSERWNKGWAMLRELSPGNPDPVDYITAEMFPDFWRMTVEHLFGEVWTRPALGLRERIMIRLTGLIFHKSNNEMADCMGWALSSGVTREEILEITMHVAHYAGWPCGVNAIHVAKDILPPAEKNDEGPSASQAEMTSSDWIEKGIGMINQLFAGKEKIWGGDLDQVFPDFWRMHLGHLFGEVYTRPGLGLRERIMVNLTGLIFHKFEFGIANCMRWALNNGIKKEEILEIIMQTAHLAGWPCGVNAIHIAGNVFEEFEDLS